MSNLKRREFWVRDNQREFGIDNTELGKTAFVSPFGVKGKDGKDCDLIHCREVLPSDESLDEKLMENYRELIRVCRMADEAFTHNHAIDWNELTVAVDKAEELLK